MIYTLIDKPLWWHIKELRETTTGYGQRLTTRYCAKVQGEIPRRVYATCWGNAASAWFKVRGETIYLPNTARVGDTINTRE